MNEDMIRYVQSACEGNTDAMARLYSGTLKVSYFLALKLTGDSESAVEVTKKAYARSFCTITKLKKPDAFEMWMKHNVTSVYRETQKFELDGIEESAPEEAMEFLSADVYTNSDKALAAVYAVDNLSPALRAAIVLHYFSGIPTNSLAKLLNTSEGIINTLLAEAKQTVAAACESGEPADISDGSLPVLTRLLQAQMETVNIPGSEVKDVFSYAVDIYNSFKQVEVTRSAAEAPAAAESNDDVSSAYEPSIPQKSTTSEAPADNDIDYGVFTDEAPVYSAKSTDKKLLFGKIDIEKLKKMRIGRFSLMQVGIAAVALLLVLIIIIAAASGKGKNKNNKNDKNPNASVSQTADTGDSYAEGDYSFIDTGLEECIEIKYLDEKCCAFKSSKTGKWGLLSYEGKVLLQPNFDVFLRCGLGRAYDGSENYHTLVTIENEQYYVTVNLDDVNGDSVVISQEAHSKHQINQQDLDKDAKYDERDRFFEGYAAARKNDKWGYISEENDKKVINYQYEAVNVVDKSEYAYTDYCRPVTGGLVAVKKDGKMGIINMKNKTIVPFEFDEILVGRNGIFIAKKDGKWGAIVVGDAQKTFQGINLVIETNIEDPDVEAFESEKRFRCVAPKGANVRADAGTDNEKVSELQDEDEVIAVGTKEAEDGVIWLKVKLDNGSYGFVIKDFLREIY